jgi:hypothetical protein
VIHIYSVPNKTSVRAKRSTATTGSRKKGQELEYKAIEDVYKNLCTETESEDDDDE